MCVTVFGVVGAFEEISNWNGSSRHATYEEPLEKITSLELELARLKSKQKKRSIQQEALSK